MEGRADRARAPGGEARGRRSRAAHGAREPGVAGRAAGALTRLAQAAALWIVAGGASTAAWALLGGDGDWPLWVWFGAGVPVALGGGLWLAWRLAPARLRWAAAHAALAAVVSAALVCVWMLTGRGGWLAWALLGIAVVFSLHAVLAIANMLPPRPHEERLSARVDALERSRDGALQLRSAELRRVERDLHDGVQSRLVAATMLLGRAEERLDGDAITGLVQQAREHVAAAVSEIRHLADGLSPPLLSERGLVAAVEGLALRVPLRVEVAADVGDGGPKATEEAAYFVVAESLTNVLKHAPDASARISLQRTAGQLVVEVADDGPGGADPDGSGLRGLRQRVEAVDGRLQVERAPAGGTLVRAELPCV